MGQFMADTFQLIPKVEAAMGWSSSLPCLSVHGVPNKIVHLWSLPTADALLGGMNFFASDSVFNLYTDLLSQCEEQKQELYTAMPYNPKRMGGGNPSQHENFLRTLNDPSMAIRSANVAPSDGITVVVNPDAANPTTPGGTYSLPSSIYTNTDYLLLDKAASIPLSMLRLGATVANMPEQTFGIGGLCYLMNLPGLSYSALPPGHSLPQLTVSQLMISLERLVATIAHAVPGTPDMAIEDALSKLVANVKTEDSPPNQNLTIYVNPDPNNPSKPTGSFYSIPPNVYTATPVPANQQGGVGFLVQQGTAAANMPGPDTPGYMINMHQLSAAATNFSKLTATQILELMRTLLKYTGPAIVGTPEDAMLESLKSIATTFK